MVSVLCTSVDGRLSPPLRQLKISGSDVLQPTGFLLWFLARFCSRTTVNARNEALEDLRIERSVRRNLEEDVEKVLGSGLVAQFEQCRQELEVSVFAFCLCITRATVGDKTESISACQSFLQLLAWRV